MAEQIIDVRVDTPEARKILQICVESGFVFYALVNGNVMTIKITGF